MSDYRSVNPNAPASVQSARLNIDWVAVEDEAVQLLSRYIRFDTSNPPGNELVAVEFLADMLAGRGFEPHLIKTFPGRANLITCLSTPAAQAPPCLLYAHADVVPANAADWSIPPFAGQIKDGFVWGRGALDSKGLGVIFVQALTLLKELSPPLSRDIILLIAADEEAGGDYGVAWLLDHHPDLIKAEYVWDEGGVGFRHSVGAHQHLYEIGIAEKGSLTVKLVAHGPPSHASVPRPDNSLDRLVQALTRVKRWRQPARLTAVVIQMLQTLAASQSFPRSVLFAKADRPLGRPFLYSILENDPLFSPLIRNTISLTMVRGGQTSNVIPAQAEAKLDIRLLPDEDPQVVLAGLRSVIADPKVTLEVEETPFSYAPSPTNTDFYRALTQTLQTIGPSGLITPYLTPGTTDSRFFRRAGMKAYGFLPMLLDVQELARIHGIDERVATANLRWGIQVVLETLLRL